MSRLFKRLCCNYERLVCSLVRIDSTKLRRLQYAFKVTMTLIVSGFIAYGTPLKTQFEQQYIICVISILSIQETVGSTISSSIQTMVSIVPLSAVAFIMQVIGLSYGDYLTTELLLLSISFIISYQYTQIQTRKVALLYNAIAFSTIVNEPKLPVIFPLLLLAVFLMGAIIGVTCSMVILPFFAVWDVECRLNYCLDNCQRMFYQIVRALLCQDRIVATNSLSRASMIGELVRQTIVPVSTRLVETNYEPVRLLHWLTDRRRRRSICLSLSDQSKLVNTFILHLSSLQSVVDRCHSSVDHEQLMKKVRVSLNELDSCQSKVIACLTSTRVSRRTSDIDEHVDNLHRSLLSFQSICYDHYLVQTRIEIDSTETGLSEDVLSCGFCLFHLIKITDLVVSTMKSREQVQQADFNVNCCHPCFQWQWFRFVASLKSTLIIGVGSIFVMVPYLAELFENGQWILIALCMTQSDNVGGALNNMKMRLVGTLLGSTWSYITYLLVHDNIVGNFVLLSPWTLVFSYLRLVPEWGYTAVVASFTPILINLGRLPYGDSLPAGNYALLRIEENFVGIVIASILAIAIFPVFATDLLKDTIQNNLSLFVVSVNAMKSQYDQMFKHTKLEDNVQSFLDQHRCRFHQSIVSQQMLTELACLEPTFVWLNSSLSKSLYSRLAEHQTNLFRALHDLDLALLSLHPWSTDESLQSSTASSYVRDKVSELCSEIEESLQLWITYFQSSQTNCYRLSHSVCSGRPKLSQGELCQYERCLARLNETVNRLEQTYRENIDKSLIDSFRTSINLPRSDATTDLTVVSILAVFCSLMHLGRVSILFGTTIREIFESETTNFYDPF